MAGCEFSWHAHSFFRANEPLPWVVAPRHRRRAGGDSHGCRV